MFATARRFDNRRVVLKKDRPRGVAETERIVAWDGGNACSGCAGAPVAAMLSTHGPRHPQRRLGNPPDNMTSIYSQGIYSARKDGLGG
jgi:hypothetical protein